MTPRHTADGGPGSPRDRGPSRPRTTRRALLAGAAAVGLGAALERAGGEARADPAPSVPFYGARQAGIATPQQRHLEFAAFDLETGSRRSLRGLLQRWADTAAALAGGREAASDAGEAAGLPPSRLTLTFGFGPTLFDERLGLAHLRPAPLAPLPPFPGELLDPARSGGDLCVQACADDPQVAFHAIHVLTRLAAPEAALRWDQRGFWPAAEPGGTTPRNLLGFKDGTANIRVDDTAALDRFVWVQPGDGPAWLGGGTYLVLRRIEIVLESWDAVRLEEQERAIGRRKQSGAPLGGRGERDPLDLGARDAGGAPLIPLDAHVRVAAPATNGGVRILRRGYSYSGGSRPGPADRGGHELDAGLFFIAFVRDPVRQFVPLQRRLATDDALGMFTVHTASAVFACPPGAAPGSFPGARLLA